MFTAMLPLGSKLRSHEPRPARDRKLEVELLARSLERCLKGSGAEPSR
jgi:hypothetical protein